MSALQSRSCVGKRAVARTLAQFRCRADRCPGCSALRRNASKPRAAGRRSRRRLSPPGAAGSKVVFRIYAPLNGRPLRFGDAVPMAKHTTACGNDRPDPLAPGGPTVQLSASTASLRTTRPSSVTRPRPDCGIVVVPGGEWRT